MYRAWLWWAFKILSQAQIEGLPKPWAWLGLKPELLYHIWLLLPKASKCIVDRHWNNQKDWKVKKREKSAMEIIQITSSNI